MKKRFFNRCKCVCRVKLGLSVIVLIMLPFHLFGQNIGKIVQNTEEFTWTDVLPNDEIQFLFDMKANNAHLTWDLDGSVHNSLEKIGAYSTGSTSSFEFFNDGVQSGWKLVNGYSIYSINLSDSNLTGSIPQSIGNLVRLDYLRLDSNQLTGEIPDSIGNLVNLENLSLANNQLSGEIPPVIGNLIKLDQLWLSNNQISGEIPHSIGNLTNLKYLFLSHNQLTGEIPEGITNLNNLIWIYLNDNQLAGELPTLIGTMTDLEDLRLNNNQLTGEIPHSIGDLLNLVSLDLESNQLSGAIPPSIGNLVELTRLSLSDNQLTGEIPQSIGDLTELERLDLYWNELSGQIPVELGNLTNLENLYLQGNMLSGVVPGSVWSLANLVNLNLSGNNFTETVFDEIGGNPSIEYLDLSWNQIEGTLPSGIENLSGLKYLYLAGNRFYGPLPGFLANLGTLSALDIRYNNFKAQLAKPAWISAVGGLMESGVTVWAEHQFWRRIAKAIVVNGTVQGRSFNDSDPVIFTISEGMWLYENDEVATGNESFCKLVSIDKSTMNIGPNSKMKVVLFSDVEPSIIDLIEGTIRSYLTKDYMQLPDYERARLYIRTRTSGTGVRGTDIEIFYNETEAEATTEIILHSGVIDVIDYITGEISTFEDTGHYFKSHTLTSDIINILDYLKDQQPSPAVASLLSVGQNDRLSNLAKIAFNLDLHDVDRTAFSPGDGQIKGLPFSERVESSSDSSLLTMTYLRRKDLELSYTPLYTTNLMEGWFPFPEPVSVTPVDEVWDEVRVEVEIPGETRTSFTVMNIGLPTSVNE